MKLRFKQRIASIFGSFAPGMIADIPNENIAKSWIRNDIAESAEDDEVTAEAVHQKGPHTSDATLDAARERPAELPEGQYWCGKCSLPHKETSQIGENHSKHRAEDPSKEEPEEEEEASEDEDSEEDDSDEE